MLIQQCLVKFTQFTIPTEFFPALHSFPALQSFPALHSSLENYYSISKINKYYNDGKLCVVALIPTDHVPTASLGLAQTIPC